MSCKDVYNGHMLDIGHTQQGTVVKSISKNQAAVTNELMSDACVEVALKELQGWIPDTLFIGIGEIQSWHCLFLTLLSQVSL